MKSDFYDKIGTSGVLINSNKGIKFISSCNYIFITVDSKELFRYNPAIIKKNINGINSVAFWKEYELIGINAVNKFTKHLQSNYINIFLKKIKSIITK